ncbi:MAG: YkvA family protein [Reyranella sp.]|nr:YkvA family protein [Reyranella sp.]
MSNSTELVGNLAASQNTVSRGFWQKARKTLGRVPFTEDAVAAFYCATDSATPLPIRATLFGALAYFVLPIDAIPDFMLGLGFTDDAAIIVAALTAAKVHITDTHRGKARAWLLKEQAARRT